MVRLLRGCLLATIVVACQTATATIIGFGETTGGANDCTSTGTACSIATPGGSPPIPNPIKKDPNNGTLLVWDEQQNVELELDLLVDRVADENASFVMGDGNGGFKILAGTIVSSHYAQWDPEPLGDPRIDTTLLFDSDIFAFITEDGKLFGSDEALGLPGFDYADFGLRGLESGDTTEFGEDLTKVEISWAATSPGDWTRIITAFSPAAVASVPEPSTLMLFSIGLLGAGLVKRYRKANA